MPDILIVDDDPRIRGILDLHIQDAFEFSTSHASDGIEAIESVRSTIPDLILMDLSMPNMNGIEAIRELRKIPGCSVTPIIFLSAETDKSRWVEAFEAGANDFVPKPFQENELLARISTHLKLASMTKELERKNRLLENDRKMAEIVQRQLLPSKLEFENFRAASLYQAQEQIGGDFFDAREQDGILHIVLGDISGHGAASALLMAVCKGILSSLSPEQTDQVQVVEEMSRTLYTMLDDGGLDMFVTLAYAVVDPARDELRLISCGHTPTRIITKNDLRSLPANAPAMGLLPEFPFQAETVPFTKGDTLFMYTDGLTELKNADRELFGEERLEALLNPCDRPGCPDDLLKNIFEAGKKFSGGKVDDDIAMLAVQRI